MSDTHTWSISISGLPCTDEGEQRCFGNNLYECQNGTWILIEQNSPQCITPPPQIPWMLIAGGVLIASIATYVILRRRRIAGKT